jgi:hypothetical protein
MGYYRLTYILETTRSILSRLGDARDVGISVFHRRKPASRIRLRIGAVRQVPVMPLQRVLARKFIMAATTFP